MIRRQQRDTRNVSGLRTRFYPKSRIGQGLVSIGPWVDILLLVAAFVLLDTRLALQPGIVVDLPQQAFQSGGHGPKVNLVVMWMGGRPPAAGREVIFFEDVRYLLENPYEQQALQEALVNAARHRPELQLALFADRQVSHGTVMDLMAMAVQAGIPEVNLAIRTLEGGGGP